MKTQQKKVESDYNEIMFKLLKVKSYIGLVDVSAVSISVEALATI